MSGPITKKHFLGVRILVEAPQKVPPPAHDKVMVAKSLLKRAAVRGNLCCARSSQIPPCRRDFLDTRALLLFLKKRISVGIINVEAGD